MGRWSFISTKIAALFIIEGIIRRIKSNSSYNNYFIPGNYFIISKSKRGNQSKQINTNAPYRYCCIIPFSPPGGTTERGTAWHGSTVGKWKGTDWNQGYGP